MRRLIYTSLLTLFFSLTLSAQTKDVFEEVSKDQVPQEVLESFNSNYPKEVADRWGIFRDTYEAKFYHDEHWVFSRYNDKGKLIENRIMMDWDKEAPKRLKEGKKKTEQKYWDVTEFYKRTTAAGDVSFILQLENDKNDLETLYFDESGVLEVKSQSGF